MQADRTTLPTNPNPNQPLTDSNRRSSVQFGQIDRNIDCNVDFGNSEVGDPAFSGEAAVRPIYEISVRQAEHRTQRFYLQTLARTLLADAPEGSVAQGTCKCLRRRISKDEGVKVLHAPGTKSAHYGNLQVCGCVWLCAVCGGKISERRRVEMTSALESSGLFKVLVTYTVRHRLNDTCDELLAALRDARKRMKGHRRWKRAAARLGLVGHIYNLEPLHNAKNGWHLHYHEILLFKHELTADQLAELEDVLRGTPDNPEAGLWGWALAQNGRDGLWEHLVQVGIGERFVQEYLAKFDKLPEKTGWTIEHELTKSAVKKSALKGRTPYELLLLYGAGDKDAGAKWLEFAVAFKGARQLVWSRGLKAQLGIVDKTDEEIALEEIEPADVLADLALEEWKAVLGLDLRAELLNIASAGDSDRLATWLDEWGIRRLRSAHVAPDIDYANDPPEVIPEPQQLPLPHDDQEPARSDAGAGLQGREFRRDPDSAARPGALLRRAHPGAPSPDHPSGEIRQIGDLPP